MNTSSSSEGTGPSAALPFAALVRRRLQERALGLREFCRTVSVDPSFFSKVLAGKRSPPSDDAVLRRIALALDLDACELIVAAGRIPNEWARLWAEPPLLEAVHRLCARGAPALSSGSVRGNRPGASAGLRSFAARRDAASGSDKTLSEELL